MIHVHAEGGGHDTLCGTKTSPEEPALPQYYAEGWNPHGKCEACWDKKALLELAQTDLGDEDPRTSLDNLAEVWCVTREPGETDLSLRMRILATARPGGRNK